MAYINLKQIGELSLEALSQKHLLNSLCYNSDSKKMAIEAPIFVAMFKTHRQAKNLYSKLSKLHQVCTDFAAGNFQPYIDEHEKWADDETPAFDPFDELESCFDTQSVDDLPERIEQYSELVVVAANFTKIRKVKRDGVKQFFGNLPMYYQFTDEAGETVMIPENELPDDIRTLREATTEIKEIETEYALDRYNEFYAHATGLLSAYVGGDVSKCAEAILSLYAPTK